MKRLLALLMMLSILLCGCGMRDNASGAIDLRQKLLQGNGCSFDATVTADYQDKLFEFRMSCTASKDGSVSFTIMEPDTIAGISGKISSDEGQLIFDDQVLVFDLLTDGLVSPVSAPWLLMRALIGGYINAGGKEGELFLYEIDDSYEENPLRLDVWLDRNNNPLTADILWDGKRVVALTVENFVLL